MFAINKARVLLLIVLMCLVAVLVCAQHLMRVERRSAKKLLGNDSVVKIEARGKRFQWNFRYPGSDGVLGSEDDVDVVKDLHLPRGAAVELTLHSDDYIYTWSSPNLGLREIAVPELTHSITFRAAKHGNYEILADPMCGWQFFHDEVLGHVIIQSDREFDDWSAKQIAHGNKSSAAATGSFRFE